MVHTFSGGTPRRAAYCRPIVSLAVLLLLMTTSTFAPVCAAAGVPSASAFVAQAMIRVRRAAGRPVGIGLLTFIPSKSAAQNRVGGLKAEVGYDRASYKTVPYSTSGAAHNFAFAAIRGWHDFAFVAAIGRGNVTRTNWYLVVSVRFY